MDENIKVLHFVFALFHISFKCQFDGNYIIVNFFILMWFSICAMIVVSKAYYNLKVKSIYASSEYIYFSTDEKDSQTPFFQQLFSRLGVSRHQGHIYILHTYDERTPSYFFLFHLVSFLTILMCLTWSNLCIFLFPIAC